MYAGNEPWRPSILDINNDDYFAHGRSGCLDLEDSSFLSRGASGSCIPTSTVLCIDGQPGDKRFRVDVRFRTSSISGEGKAIPLANLGISQGGIFWFFSQDNPELLVKVLDACAFNSSFWVFYSAGTDVELTLIVRTQSRGEPSYTTTIWVWLLLRYRILPPFLVTED